MIEELLRVRGIGPTAAERLINSGIKSIDEIANSKPEELAWIKGIGMVSASKIIENALELI
ncbi:MAG: helix-hairpin-helix domain-containing protein, partial [Candidatus Thorarchaeota archaeon]